MSTRPNFIYWNATDPAGFLADDWENPSRIWAGLKVREAIAGGACSLVEVGPGPGIDYERQFRALVKDGKLYYTGFEGSSNFCQNLADKFPESVWRNLQILDLPPGGFDVVYEKAVLEHQPCLEPCFSTLLAAARRHVVIIWYRPPHDAPFVHAIGPDGCHYCTFNLSDVLALVERAGWKVIEQKHFENPVNEGWVLGRRS